MGQVFELIELELELRAPANNIPVFLY